MIEAAGLVDLNLGFCRILLTKAGLVSSRHANQSAVCRHACIFVHKFLHDLP